MNKELQERIKTSTFEVVGPVVYVKVAKAPDIGKHFMVSKDKDEITVITRPENLKHLDVIEKNKDIWSLIALNVSAPFYSVGFLATVTSAIAKSGMNVLVVSTYSKDYIMVTVKNVEKSKKILISLGFKQAS